MGEGLGERLLIFQYMKHLQKIVLSALLIASGSVMMAQKQKKEPPKPPVYVGADNKLAYIPDAQGNRIPDFSYCGYMASEQAIPTVPVKVTVPFKSGDATLRIQSALDYVAALKPDKSGFRGAVLLEKGTYEVSGKLLMKTSGVVLRGSGMGEGGTTILATGAERDALIRIVGKNDCKKAVSMAITDKYVPVNATELHLTVSHNLKAGDKIFINRPFTAEWLQTLGTLHFGGGITALGWKPGDRDIQWDRTVVAVNGDRITLDAPLTTALDVQYGGATVTPYLWNGRISRVGVENLKLESTFNIDNLKDEDHRWQAVTMDNVQDSWVRRVIFKHFAGSAVAVWETSKRVTVEDCKSLEPISEIAGQRRYTFRVTGQQTLVQRCFAEKGYHDFSVGFTAPGPNAFVQCYSSLPYSFSGAIDSWASGVLFDIVDVDGNALRFANRGQDANGAGWSAANSMFWQCWAARIDCYRPPTANNWAFGCWAQFAGDGTWFDSNNHIQPVSLYYAQLKDRLGKDVSAQAQILPLNRDATSSPTVAQAQECVTNSNQPPLQLIDWIDRVVSANPISLVANGTKSIDQVGVKQPASLPLSPALHIVNGWLVRGDKPVIGDRTESPWWNGGLLSGDIQKAKPSINRFVPGRVGKGLTEDLDDMTDSLVAEHKTIFEHNYPLWYDRRRDDHERIRRMDGEVWPPFYELPFARTGKDFAWDGLSKYDLTKYDQWYWLRMKRFADLADQKGLVLVNQHYFQHNIIEAGAHWVDSPWRTANNVNQTGFPEPPPFAGDKRIFQAHLFYDVNHPVRRELHRAYIRQCLNNYKDNNGVIHMVSAEYTGPTHFVKFWLDVIDEWEKETGKKVIVALSTTKDVQDSILADPKRAAVVDMIDIRYWWYKDKGGVYAPQGGVNLAPRQHMRLDKYGNSTFPEVYRAVKEYRANFPGKAVAYSAISYPQAAWGAFMAGGSMAALPEVPAQFLADAAKMNIVSLPGNPDKQYALGEASTGYIVYAAAGKTISLDLTASKGKFTVRWINPKDGSVAKNVQAVNGGSVVNLTIPKSEDVVAWISRK